MRTRSALILVGALLSVVALAGCGSSGGGPGNPQVTATSPVNGATGVAVTTAVTATFDRDMDAATLTTATFVLNPAALSATEAGRPSRAQAVTATVTYDAASRTATLTPESALSYNTTYNAALTTEVKDSEGQPLAALTTWAFTTAESNPSIVSHTPASGSIDIPVSVAVTATFNKDMDPTTILASNFRLEQTIGPTGVLSAQAVASTITYDAATRTATLSPAAFLTPGAGYTATVLTGVCDTEGHALPADVSWSFTTAATPPPTLIYINAGVLMAEGGTIRLRENSSSGTVISDATVTVNGFTFPFRPDSNDYFLWGGGFHVDPGAACDLTVSWRGLTITGQCRLPYPPGMTAPVEGSNNSISVPTLVTWNFGGNPLPDYYISVNGRDPYSYSPNLAVTATDYTFPAGTFTSGSGYLMIYAYNYYDAFAGPAAPSSYFTTGNSQTVSVNWVE